MLRADALDALKALRRTLIGLTSPKVYIPAEASLSCSRKSFFLPGDGGGDSLGIDCALGHALVKLILPLFLSL
jgi:hypothetical protein